MWETIQYVTTGLTLVSFMVSVIAWVYKAKSEERERLIKAASEETRAELVRLTLEVFDVDPAGLTKEQKYQLALAQIHAKAKRFRTTAIVVCVMAVILAAISAYAISVSNNRSGPLPPPERISERPARIELPTREQTAPAAAPEPSPRRVVVLCSTAMACGAKVGFVREIEGNPNARTNAEKACAVNDMDLVDFSVEDHPINCGQNYGLVQWMGTRFLHNELPICSRGTVNVIKSIDCEPRAKGA